MLPLSLLFSPLLLPLISYADSRRFSPLIFAADDTLIFYAAYMPRCFAFHADMIV